MMPVVRLNDATFSDLSALKIWFGTNTPSETIDCVVRESMDRLGMERDVEPVDDLTNADDGAIEFTSAPGLAFTKPSSASINGNTIGRLHWSSILLAMIAQLKAKGFEGEKLVHVLQVSTKTTAYEEEGFKYHPDLGISVQGQSSSDAWKEIDRIAKKWKIPVVVEFYWLDHRKAKYPGKTGRMKSGGA